MFLNLNEFRDPHARVDEVYEPAAFGAPREGDRAADVFRVVGPVSLGFDLYRDEEQFHLVGTVKGRLELACGRCLEPFEFPVDTAFDLRYQPREAGAVEGEREIREDDLATAFYEDDRIDLDQLMREQFYLVLPMKPLCRELCRGLCPACGANLNTGACACQYTWDDPRFAALKALRDDQSKRH
jgi:DUF177 domain-containing protein